MAQTSEVLELLKEKYQPVLTLMNSLRVQTLSISLDGTKLVIRGVAPTLAAKNRVWDQIKRIDPAGEDLICDLSVSAQQQQKAAAQEKAAMSMGASAGGGQNQRRYTVKPGDTLTKISREFYGDANQFTKIVEANRSQLPDANAIRPGQDLVIPE
jgi:nucleoid-associated protein YgaU